MGTKLVSRGDALEPVYLNNLRVAARGWGVVAGLAVSQKGAGADMSVDVAAGDAWINNTLVSKGSITNVAVSAAHATYDRYDLVVINSSGTIGVIAGTAAATAYANDYDFEANNAILLAEIYVPAADTAIENSQITDKRIFWDINGHGNSKHTGATANLLSGLTPTFSGWNTNPGTNADLVNELTDTLTTNGVAPAGSDFGATITYDTGTSQRRSVALLFNSNVSNEVQILGADDNISYYVAGGLSVGYGKIQSTSAIVKARHLRFAFWRHGTSVNTVSNIKMRAYAIN